MSQARTKGNNFTNRRFWITFWHEVDGIFNDPKIQYICQCYDQCSKEHDGKFHGHAFIYFKTPQRFSKVVKFYGDDCHNESMIKKNGKKRINSHMINYVMNPAHKHGATKFNRLEFGERPKDNGMHFNAKEAIEMETNEINELNLRDAAMVLNIREKMKKEMLIDSKIEAWRVKKNELPPVEVIYHTGKSGNGKTWEIDGVHEECDNLGLNGVELAFVNSEFWTIAEMSNREAMIKPEVIIINEYRDSTMKVGTFLQMLERRGVIPVKGGEIPCANIKKVVICSIIPPEKLYRGVKDVENIDEELKRRITKIIEHKKIDGEYFAKNRKWIDTDKNEIYNEAIIQSEFN